MGRGAEDSGKGRAQTVDDQSFEQDFSLVPYLMPFVGILCYSDSRGVHPSDDGYVDWGDRAGCYNDSAVG